MQGIATGDRAAVSGGRFAVRNRGMYTGDAGPRRKSYPILLASVPPITANFGFGAVESLSRKMFVNLSCRSGTHRA